MTEDDLWRAVGRELEDIRERKGWKNPIDVHRAGHGTPNYATVVQHERGKIKTFASLAEHTKVLGVSIVDVLSAILERSKRPLSQEAATLLRQFEQLTVPDRQILVGMSERLFAQHERNQRMEAAAAMHAASTPPKSGPKKKA